MATNYFRGDAASPNLNTAAQWSLGTVIANDEIGVIDHQTAVPTPRVIPGFDHSAVDCQDFYVTDGWNGDIGSGATPFTIAVSSVVTDSDPRFVYDGTGNSWIAAGTNGIDTMEINRTGSGTFTLTGGTVDVLYVSGGRVLIAAGCRVNTIYILNGTVTAEAHATNGFTTVYHMGGTFNNYRDITTAYDNGGITNTEGTTTITTLNLQGPITHNYKSNQTIGTANHTRGTLTTSGSPYSAGTVTITNYNRARAGTSLQDPIKVFDITNDIGYGRPTDTGL